MPKLPKDSRHQTSPIPHSCIESEPYTVDNDPEYRFVDAELTPKGIGQAEALAARANRLAPELMVSRPLARAGARAGRGRS